MPTHHGLTEYGVLKVGIILLGLRSAEVELENAMRD